MNDPPRPGLCETCTWRKDVVTARSRFVLCGRAADDPTFPKYPRLPVLRCDGYVPAEVLRKPPPG